MNALDFANCNKGFLERIYCLTDVPGGNGFYTNAQGGDGLTLSEVDIAGFTNDFNIYADHIHLSRCVAHAGKYGFYFHTAGADITGISLHAIRQDGNGDGFFVSYPTYQGQLTLVSPYSEQPPTYAPTDFEISSHGSGSCVLIQNPASYRSTVSLTPTVYVIDGGTNHLITPVPLTSYANNAAAVSAGLPVGMMYRAGDYVAVVHP